MQDPSLSQAPIEPDVSFGLTEKDIKSQGAKTVFKSTGNFFLLIWPAFVKILSTAIYYILKLIKSFFKTAIQMIKGGGS